MSPLRDHVFQKLLLVSFELDLGVGRGATIVVNGVGTEVGTHVTVSQVGDFAVGYWGGGTIAGIELLKVN